MDLSSENSCDSVEIDDLQLLTAMRPLHSDVTVSDHSAILNGTLHMENHDLQQQRRVLIVEQPQQRGFRFRYECEGPSHGGLQGEKTERGRKTYPSIRIENYSGPAQIEVSLVTDENHPRVHAHKLVGKNCTDGICRLEMNSTGSDISFPNLCILHVTRKKAAEVLLNRILEDVKLKKKMNNSNMIAEPSPTAEEHLNAKQQAHELARSMSLNVVRLQFRVFLPNVNNQYLDMLPPVVSQPIYDSKSPGASALKICRMDKYGGCCTGNEEVFLLCEKVQKEDISVRFVEQNIDGSVKWEAYGNFSPLDVHRQYAIVFKTPPYYNANIDKAVNVMIMLQRKSDAEVSEAKAFTYYPQNKDKDNIARKKRKTLPLDSSFNYYGGDGGSGGGSGGGMGGGFGPAAPGGPGGTLGGGGGDGGQGSYSVIMPNGRIVDQLNVLPTTVEQVVKEEFARRHAESPDTTSTEDSSQSPMASPFDPILWSTSYNDLEIDAATSLRHPSENLITKVHPTPAKDSHVIPAGAVGTIPSNRRAFEKMGKVEKLDSLKGCMEMQKNTSSEKDRQGHSEIKESLEFPNIEKMVPCAGIVGTDLIGSKSADRAIADVSDANRIAKKQVSVTEESEGDSGREEPSDILPSPTVLSEAMASEGFRTDEGFSEVSEEVSVKDEALRKEIEMEETVLPPKSSSKIGTKEKSSKPVKVATSVVKRVMERITARTIRALQEYSETGDVRYLLMVQRHLLTIKNENGDLPIHLAVINSQTASLRSLLDVMMSLPNCRQFINVYNYMRQTPLHLAAIMQLPLHIELLLHAGADPSLADRNGNTPAHLAVLYNSPDSLQSLIKYLRPGVTATNPFPELDYLNFDGYTPVHLAAQNGSVDMLRLLVHGQADVDLPDGKSGRTALHHAVELDDLPVAGFLLMEANADVNARCFDGNTPLHIACCRGLIGMVALLMTAGAYTDIENEEIPSEDILQHKGRDSEKEGATSRRCRRGLQPRDYVAGENREQILRLLMGDQYVTDSEDEQEFVDENDFKEDTGKLMMTHKSTYDSGVAISLNSQSVSSLPADDKLSCEMREELSKLLDPVCDGKDVFALAIKLGYDSFVSALEVMGCSGSSPTRYLLDYYETYEDSICKLKECLQAIDRDDAVKLITGGDRGLMQRKQHVDTSFGDSGVVSFSS